MGEPMPAVACRNHWLPETVIVSHPGTQDTPAQATSKGSDIQAGHCYALLKFIHGLLQSSRCMFTWVFSL